MAVVTNSGWNVEFVAFGQGKYRQAIMFWLISRASTVDPCTTWCEPPVRQSSCCKQALFCRRTSSGYEADSRSDSSPKISRSFYMPAVCYRYCGGENSKFITLCPGQSVGQAMEVSVFIPESTIPMSCIVETWIKHRKFQPFGWVVHVRMHTQEFI